MRITVDRNKFKAAISMASKALPKAVIQIERGHLFLSTDQQTLKVDGTNNDLKARVTVPITRDSNTEEIAFTLDPKVIEKLISKVSLQSIVIDYDPAELTVKIYTEEGLESFNTFQSFPADKMLKVKDIDLPIENTINVKKDVLLTTVEFIEDYLESGKEENKKYDFIIINSGVVFGANGRNKMGFFVNQDYKDAKNIKIRRSVVPALKSIISLLDQDEITIGDQNNYLTFTTPQSYFSFLKSSVESPKIDLDMLKQTGPYIVVSKKELLNRINRLAVSKSGIVGIGLEMILKGGGEDACLELASMTNLKSKERIKCRRINDTSADEISHFIDLKLFKTVVDSFEVESLNIFIGTNSPFFKIVCVVKDELKYMAAGIASYSRIVKQ